MINAEFYEQSLQPTVKAHVDWGVLRRTSWTHIVQRNGEKAHFVSWWFLGHLQVYHGSAKNNGSLSDLSQEPPVYTMTDKPSELRTVRWRSHGPNGPPAWNDMGGT